jgi:hypothetical protein
METGTVVHFWCPTLGKRCSVPEMAWFQWLDVEVSMTSLWKEVWLQNRTRDTHSLAHWHMQSLTLTFSYTHIFTHTHNHWLTLAVTHIYTLRAFSHFHTPYVTLSHNDTFTQSPTLTLPLSVKLTPTHLHTQSHTVPLIFMLTDAPLIEHMYRPLYIQSHALTLPLHHVLLLTLSHKHTHLHSHSHKHTHTQIDNNSFTHSRSLSWTIWHMVTHTTLIVIAMLQLTLTRTYTLTKIHAHSYSVIHSHTKVHSHTLSPKTTH